MLQFFWFASMQDFQITIYMPRSLTYTSPGFGFLRSSG
ncbi:hypothetical protein O59_000406 [Cellvibrio sp. BR]|nr:hypothetical protein O59_000406 [Cellvibrio sp. BR]